MTTNFNASTPQLKTIKNLFDAYLTRDFSNAEPFLSKDFKLQTFPKIAGLPDLVTEGHNERYGTLFSLMTDIEHHVHEVIEASGKVVIYHTGIFHTPDGDKLDYDSLTILSLVEFKDSSDPEKRANVHSLVAKTLAKSAA